MSALKWLAIALGAGVATALGVAAYGAARWAETTRVLLARLEAARLPPAVARYDAREIAGLPAPVQRYFRRVLTDGQPIVTAVSLEQAGTMNMSETAQQWKPFTATQRVLTRRPGFDWDARIMMFPGVPVHVHDAYIAGAGTLHGALLGLVPVVDMAGTPEMAQGELLRYFAETAWYPTALLPSQGVRWQAIDEQSAQATLTDAELSVTMTFTFQEDGLINTVRAEARGRVVGGKASSAPWQGRFWNYALRDGMRVPLEGEVAWVVSEATPAGAQTYWRGKVTALRYAFAPD
jgi:hypothetical protein